MKKQKIEEKNSTKWEEKLKKEGIMPPSDPPPGFRHPQTKDEYLQARKSALKKLSKSDMLK